MSARPGGYPRQELYGSGKCKVFDFPNNAEMGELMFRTCSTGALDVLFNKYGRGRGHCAGQVRCCNEAYRLR